MQPQPHILILVSGGVLGVMKRLENECQGFLGKLNPGVEDTDLDPITVMSLPNLSSGLPQNSLGS